MAIKLASILKNPTLRLAFKAAVFGLLFYLLQAGNFGLFPVLLFLIGAAFLYASPLFRTFELITPFIFLIAVSLLAGWAALGTGYFYFLVVITSILFYLILGIKDLVLIQRTVWLRVINLSLVYISLVLFLLYNQELFWFKSLLLFLAIVLSLRDVLKKKIAAWLIAFFVLEGVWAMSILPIGFLSSASAVLLIYFTLSDLAFNYFESTLTRRRILTDITVFALTLLLILGLSKWGT